MENEADLLKNNIKSLMSTIENLLKKNEAINKDYLIEKAKNQDSCQKYEDYKECHEKKMESMREELKKENDILQNQLMTLLEEANKFRENYDELCKGFEYMVKKLTQSELETENMREALKSLKEDMVKAKSENEIMKNVMEEVKASMTTFNTAAHSFFHANISKMDALWPPEPQANGNHFRINGQQQQQQEDHDKSSLQRCNLCSKEFGCKSSMLEHARFCQGLR